MKINSFYVFLISSILLNSSPSEAGQNKGKQMELIDDKIGEQITSPLVHIHNEDGIIKTKSQKPTAPKLQHAISSSILARPIEEFYEDEEKVLKKIDPGKDGRILVDQTDIWPNSVHGVVYIRFKSSAPDSYGWGSGTLISPRIVLTAAHNLYDYEKKERAVELRFLPAINGKSLSFPEPKVVEFYYPKTYTQSKKEDYGILVLDTPIGEQTGYFGLAVLPSEKLKELEINVTGYPGDKVKDKDRYYEMWGMKGKPVNLDDGYIQYEIDTYNGQSGSGVTYQENEDHFVVGVHVLGDTVLGRNSATVLTEKRYNKINKWIEKSIRNRIKEVALDGVEELDLSNSSIGDFGVKELVKYNLPHLKTLNLGGNSMSQTGVKLLTNNLSINLTNLNLWGNKIDEEGMANIVKLTNLTSLNVGYTFPTSFSHFKRYVKNEIYDFANLKQREYFAEWQVKQIIKGLPHLLRLNIAGDNINNEAIRDISKYFTSLRSLDVDSNKINDEGIRKISKYLTNLRSLSVAHNTKITNVGLFYIARLNQLTSLIISKINIRFIEKTLAIPEDAPQSILPGIREIVIGCPNLIRLYTDQNNFNDHCCKKLIKYLPNLKYLSLSSTSITDVSIEAIEQGLPQLIELDLTYNSFEVEGKAAIERLKKRDNLEVLY